mmetsp:Transcript_1625/g.2580  ORF Transcript_1625/g.2580 Transcript_1625/m.2580 type:complete len:94 (+) Transcript_1625:60-341(+)
MQSFFDSLAEFYELTRESGSVWVTIKRVPSNEFSEDTEANARRPYSCLVRAKIDKKHATSNIFTIVSPNNVVQFSSQLTGLMKHKCTNLTKIN